MVLFKIILYFQRKFALFIYLVNRNHKIVLGKLISHIFNSWIRMCVNFKFRLENWSCGWLGDRQEDAIIVNI